jgi:cell division protein FtsX
MVAFLFLVLIGVVFGWLGSILAIKSMDPTITK